MDSRKQFSINREKWKEATRMGWGIGSIKRVEDRYQEEVPELVRNFVENKCPAICEVFYNAIQDGLISAGANPDFAIEFCEEMVAMPLDEILIDLGMEYCPELIKEVK